MPTSRHRESMIAMCYVTVNGKWIICSIKSIYWEKGTTNLCPSIYLSLSLPFSMYLRLGVKGTDIYKCTNNISSCNSSHSIDWEISLMSVASKAGCVTLYAHGYRNLITRSIKSIPRWDRVQLILLRDLQIKASRVSLSYKKSPRRI